MIHKIYANKASFKSVEFQAGLNLIVAERADDSDDKDTVNSRGKSTLLRIVNFCLGSDASRSGLVIDELTSWVFSLDVSLGRYRITVSRGVDEPNRIYIESYSPVLPGRPEEDEASGRRYYSLAEWKRIVGDLCFSLSQEKEKNVKTRPLLSYFLRQGLDAYSKPFSYFASQRTDDYKLLISFLIGLNAGYSAQWSEYSRKQKAAKALDEAIKAGIQESEGDLEAEKLRVTARIETAKRRVSEFRVHDNYHDIQNEADRLTTEIHQLSNLNVVANRKLRGYQKASEEEQTSDGTTVEQLFSEAGVALPDAVVKSLEEVRNFHSSVITNRSTFLASEIERIKNEIAYRKMDILSLENQRAAKMQVLESHGALEEYATLQTEVLQFQRVLGNIETKLKELQSKSETLRQIKRARIDLVGKAKNDHEERRQIWEYAMRQFDENSEALYSSSGNFTIDIKDTGYQFAAKIPGGKGEGITRMTIFCFDLMLLAMQKKLDRGMDFLFHDSIIYDGVDPRQRAHAIERAHQVCNQHNLQYIFSLNENQVPSDEFSEGFNLQEFVRLRLTDEDGGSLLGLDF